MKTLVLLAAVALLLLLSARSQATTVEYDWHTISTTGGLPLNYAPVLRVDSSVLTTGLNFDSTCPLTPPFNCTVTGSTAGFVSLTDASVNDHMLNVRLAFVNDGTLSGSITDMGQAQDLVESGAQFLWSVESLISDRFPICGVHNPCTAQGYWLDASAVPEPSGTVILITSIGLLVVAIPRRIFRAR